MTSQKSLTYSLTEIENIIYQGIDYKLSEQVVQRIQIIAEKVGAPEYIKTPQFVNTKERKNKSFENNVLDNDWKTIRNFETTKKLQKIGIDLVLDSIRKLLNKITEKNYNTLLPKIILEIDNALQEELSCEDKTKISEIIFQVLSETQFYSEIYARLYKYLLEKYPFLNEILEYKKNNFIELLDNLKYISPKEDYDEYCNNNKLHEKINAVGLFLINLVNIDLLDKIDIIKIIIHIQNKIINYINQENMEEIIQILAEIEGTIIIKGKDLLKSAAEWDDIYDHLNLISNYKPSEFKSLTNKTIFRNMDILDVL